MLNASNPDWTDLLYFLTLAEQGTLSASARQLNVEHTTVARRVESLEKSLNLRLFDRLPRAWRLTAEAEALLPRARRVREEILAFQRAAAGSNALAGVVRISAPPVFANRFLLPGLLRLKDQWPEIDLELMGESRASNLNQGEADLAIRMSRPDAAGLAVRLLGQTDYALAGRADWLGKPQSQWQFIAYDDSLKHTPQQQWLDSLLDGRRVVMKTNDLGNMLLAAQAGLGLAVLPAFLLQGDRCGLDVIRLECKPPSRQVWLVVHPDVRRSPRVRLMADLIAQVMEAGKDLLREA
ncbi:MAG TPA: LysR family transcriptional regulator [Limnobacter sp.]|nr:LysR family transcriptional regulator [Limnobacter sp.]HEX5487364.1 LysR family transcriptional regulator [Limnobacter sp.]